MTVHGKVESGLLWDKRNVALARCKSQDDRVLLKLVGGLRYCRESDIRRRIERSIGRAGEIRGSHPCLTALRDVRWTDGYGFITVNEFVPGVSSGRMVAGLSPRKLRSAGIWLLDALDHIHLQGGCHGDVCSDNVVMDERGEAFLVDFDLVRPVPGISRTRRAPVSQKADVTAFSRMFCGWLSSVPAWTPLRTKLARPWHGEASSHIRHLTALLQDTP